MRDLLVARRAVGVEGTYVFPAIMRTNKAGYATDLSAPFGDIAEATSIRVSAHDLRRTWATLAEACDVSPLAIKALFNHALPRDVTSGYIRLTTDRLREPAQRVADRIAELCGVKAPEGVTKLA